MGAGGFASAMSIRTARDWSVRNVQIAFGELGLARKLIVTRPGCRLNCPSSFINEARAIRTLNHGWTILTAFLPVTTSLRLREGHMFIAVAVI
jgi:hypothetical protein